MAEHDRRPGHVRTGTATTIASNWDDLTDGTLRAAVLNDENGKAVPAPGLVWTATSAVGAGFDGPACAAWTDGDSSNSGGAGSALVSLATCSEPKHLYCVEY